MSGPRSNARKGADLQAAARRRAGRKRSKRGKEALIRSVQNRLRPQRQAAPVGRNDPCPCGSGKKWKKCCGQVINVRDPDQLRA